MSFPISVQAENGQFRASMVGEDSVFALGATREEAISSVEKEIAKRLASGELVALDVDGKGLPGLFGKYADDEDLSSICEEAYAETRSRPRPTATTMIAFDTDVLTELLRGRPRLRDASSGDPTRPANGADCCS